jgi:hypothetical protein
VKSYRDQSVVVDDAGMGDRNGVGDFDECGEARRPVPFLART